MLPSFLGSWSKSLGSLRSPTLNVDEATQLEKRSESVTAFDQNPDGSKFLWVLQDTYQGNTFFEYVAT